MAEGKLGHHEGKAEGIPCVYVLVGVHRLSEAGARARFSGKSVCVTRVKQAPMNKNKT